jgi:hydrogenase maturation factor
MRFYTTQGLIRAKLSLCSGTDCPISVAQIRKVEAVLKILKSAEVVTEVSLKILTVTRIKT